MARSRGFDGAARPICGFAVIDGATDGARAGVEETRTRILAAARDLYVRLGSRGTTTREVALRAGVNEATVFRHFGTKQQLLEAMLQVYCGASTLAQVIPTLTGTLEEQLRTLGFHSIEALTRKADLIKISMGEEVANPGSALAWTVPLDSQRMLSDYLASKIAAGELRGDPMMLARMFMSLFFSYVMGRRLWEAAGAQTPDEVVGLAVDHFLNGAKAK